MLVPESADWKLQGEYLDQIHWEWEGLNQATVIAFWVPRQLDTLPAFTTNVEFGLYAASGKVLLGCPHNAPKMRYLEELAARYHLPQFRTLPDLMQAAVARTQTAFGAL